MIRPKLVSNVFVLMCILAFSHCKDDDPEYFPVNNSVFVQLSHQFGSDDLKLAGPYYVTSVSDSFQPTTIIYHINDFALIDQNNKTRKITNKYFMADLSNPKTLDIELGQFEPVKYKAIEFTIGVADSLTNVNGLINHLFTAPMYWAMSSGYINFKLEGNSPNAPQNSVAMHVGGYLEPYKLSRRIHIDFTEGLDTEKGNATVTIKVDLAKYFNGMSQIKLSEIHLIHAPGDDAKKIADNIPAMFSFGKISYN